jgi:hypothetical protein
MITYNIYIIIHSNSPSKPMPLYMTHSPMPKGLYYMSSEYSCHPSVLQKQR